MADLHEAAKNSQHKEPVCDDVRTHPDFAWYFFLQKIDPDPHNWLFFPVHATVLVGNPVVPSQQL